METYKKPVITSKKPSSSTVMKTIGAPFILAKLFGDDDDFHVADSLTPRKEIDK